MTGETSILNFPPIDIREAQERPERMEEGAVMMTGLSLERVQQAIAILATQGRGDQRDLRAVADYSMPAASTKAMRILHSYTGYVRRVMWQEYQTKD